MCPLPYYLTSIYLFKKYCEFIKNFIIIEAVLDRLRMEYNSGTKRVKIPYNELLKLYITYILFPP